jgi:four helix bundle protein
MSNSAIQSSASSGRKCNHMGEIKDHRDLEAWQVAMDAVTVTYKLSVDFPRSETYGLCSQMRRAAVSVPSNIAEGQARSGRAALNHISIALGSFAELDTQLEVAVRLAYLARPRAADLQTLIDSGRRLLFGLRRAKRAHLAASLAAKTGLLLCAVFLLS